MEEQRQDVGNKLQQQEALIDEQNKLLNQEKEAQNFRRSMIEDFVEEVNYVDRKDWRQKGQGSDSSDGESEYTETEPGQSLE